MSKGTFVWAELSTYHIDSSLEFYKNVFGWSIENLSNYYLAKKHNEPVAGIFETPDFLKKINMPHFWMSYFQVESTQKSVEIAHSLNAKIEISSTEFNNGDIALIRDPQGAGFTIYDGKELYFPLNQNDSQVIKTELHVSNIDEVLPFYEKIFGWKYEQQSDGIFDVKLNTSRSDIQIVHIDNQTKGKYEYWVTTIQVANLENTKRLILQNGGHLVSSEQKRYLMADNSGEAFFYIEEHS